MTTHAACSCHSPSRRLLLAGMAALPIMAACDRAPDIDLVPDEAVVELGLQTWRSMLQSTPASGNEGYQNTLRAIAERLLRSAALDPAQWETVVFASPDANAFALPGNKIGVFEGMFDVIGSEDQLAAIVGHEIGHLQAEHSQERLNAQVAKEAGLSLVTVILQSGDVQFAREIAAALGLGVEFGLVLPYSRNQELEADKLGLVMMNQAGFNPAEAVELWRRMQAASDARVPDFLSTHPAPEQRIQAIEAMLPELQGSAGGG